MALLERDPVRVARLEVLDQHLAGDLVLAAGGDREVDLDERVRVAVEDGGRALLLEQLDVLEPVDVRAGRGRDQVDVLDQRDVLLVGEAVAGEVLGVDPDDLLGLARRCCARGLISRSPPLRSRLGRQVVDGVLDVALEQALDLVQRALLATGRGCSRCPPAARAPSPTPPRSARTGPRARGCGRRSCRRRARASGTRASACAGSCSTRVAASSTTRRLRSSGSCVVIPTGQRPVWQW